MSFHVLHSPAHGQLQVVTAKGVYEHGRTWRAVLAPRLARLEHLLAVDGVSEAEVLGMMAAAVERYDATGVVPRGKVFERRAL